MSKALLSLFTASVCVCYAQADRASVTGTIMDPSRSIVPQAAVSIIYSQTGLRRDTTSSGSGLFHLGGLPIGECHVEVSAPGFRHVRTEPFTLSVGETRTLDVSLEI